MVYVLINLKIWNAVTIGDLVLWVSMALIQSRIKLYSHTFVLCVRHMTECNQWSGCLKGNFIYLFIF